MPLNSPRMLLSLALLTTLVALPGIAHAGVVSPVQSNASPMRLTTWGPVQLYGSDDRALNFNTNVLPDIQQSLNLKLGETKSIASLAGISLDPSRLKLSVDSTVRTYFVGEGAGYLNSVGMFTGVTYTNTSGLAATDAKLIFPNASASNSYMSPNAPVVRDNSTPLASGDFVDLGSFSAGTQLNFFNISNGAAGGANVYTADPTQNPDGLVHAVSFALAIKNSPYLVIALEDLYGGGDRDYNDVVIAVDIGAANIQKLVASMAPLPPGWVMLLGITAGIMTFALLKKRFPALRRPSTNLS
jgi:hypothetical protein